MVRDYSERRQKRPNPPPKRPATWPYVLLILFLMLLAYLAGCATSWYLYRPGGRFYKAAVTQPKPAGLNKGAVLPPQGEPIVPASPQQSQLHQSPAQPAADKTAGAPPLTFYNTLQKGNKGLMGTGINQPKEGQPPAPLKPATPLPPER